MILDMVANFFPYVIAAMVVAVIVGVLVLPKKKQLVPASYEKQVALLSAAEINFYTCLLQVAPEDCIVFSKVRIADVLKVRKGYNKSQRQTAFNKISVKHFDFVLCSRESLSVRSAVELDDKSHNSQKAKTRDAFVDAACTDAQLPLLRIRAAASYNIVELRESLTAHLESTDATQVSKF